MPRFNPQIPKKPDECGYAEGGEVCPACGQAMTTDPLEEFDQAEEEQESFAQALKRRKGK